MLARTSSGQAARPGRGERGKARKGLRPVSTGRRGWYPPDHHHRQRARARDGCTRARASTSTGEGRPLSPARAARRGGGSGRRQGGTSCRHARRRARGGGRPGQTAVLLRAYQRVPSATTTGGTSPVDVQTPHNSAIVIRTSSLRTLPCSSTPFANPRQGTRTAGRRVRARFSRGGLPSAPLKNSFSPAARWSAGELSATSATSALAATRRSFVAVAARGRVGVPPRGHRCACR